VSEVRSKCNLHKGKENKGPPSLGGRDAALMREIRETHRSRHRYMAFKMKGIFALCWYTLIKGYLTSFSVSRCKVSNGMIRVTKRNWKRWRKKSSPDLSEVKFRNLSEQTEEDHENSIRIDNLRAESWTLKFLHTKWPCHTQTITSGVLCHETRSKKQNEILTFSAHILQCEITNVFST
jgi:hypothetical protein